MRFEEQLGDIEKAVGESTSRADARAIENDPILDVIATRGDEEDVRTLQSLLEALIFRWPPDAKERAARDATRSAKPRPIR